MKFILSAHKLKVQISFLHRTSMAYAQCYATKLALTKLFIYLDQRGGMERRLFYYPFLTPLGIDENKFTFHSKSSNINYMFHSDSLKIENFRIFGNEENFEFAPLTILTGTNGSGKSTLIKAIDILSKYSKACLKNAKNDPQIDLQAKLTKDNIGQAIGSFNNILSNPNSPLTFEIPIQLDGIKDNLGLQLTFDKGENKLNEGRLCALKIFSFSENKNIIHLNIAEYTLSIDLKYFYSHYINISEEYRKYQTLLQPFLKDLSIIEVDKNKRVKIKSTIEAMKKSGITDENIIREIEELEYIDHNAKKVKFNKHFPYFIESFCRPKNVDALNDPLRDWLIFHTRNLLAGPSDPIMDKLIELLETDKISPQETQNTSFFKKMNDSFIKNILHEVITLKLTREQLNNSNKINSLLQSINDPIKQLEDVMIDDIEEGFEKEDSLKNIPLVIKGSYFFMNLQKSLSFHESRHNPHPIIFSNSYFFFQEFVHDNLVKGLVMSLSKFIYVESMPVVKNIVKRVFGYSSEENTFNNLILQYASSYKKIDVIKRFHEKYLRSFKIGEELEIRDSEGVVNFVHISQKNASSINIADLGYGSSQVIAILMKISIVAEKYYDEATKSFKECKLMIEEPETNLHPALQSLLADLFVDASKQFNIKFIIETHSEYLIRKIQYLTASLESPLRAEDTMIYYFHHPDEIPSGEDHVKKINILKDGSLTDNFGQGFFDEATSWKFELLKLSNFQKN